MSLGRAFHQAGARTEKALALVEASFISLGPGTLSRFWSDDPKALGGGIAEEAVPKIRRSQTV